jgi:hypothetical protein
MVVSHHAGCISRKLTIFGVRKCIVANKHKFRPTNRHHSWLSFHRFAFAFVPSIVFSPSLGVTVYAVFVSFLAFMVHENPFLKTESMIIANIPPFLLGQSTSLSECRIIILSYDIYNVASCALPNARSSCNFVNTPSGGP